MPQSKRDIRRTGKRNLTVNQIKHIHRRKLAIPGAIYTDVDGTFYIGLPSRRLVKTNAPISGDISSSETAGALSGGTGEVTVNTIGGVSAERIAELNEEVEELLQCIANYFEIDINGDLMAMCDIHKEFDDHLFDIDENGDFMPTSDGIRSAHFEINNLGEIQCKAVN